MRDETTLGLSRSLRFKQLWKAFFADPSQWWDYRRPRKNPKAPDFQHKVTKEMLWLDSAKNPSWVYNKLEKADRAVFASLPTPVLEELKPKKALLEEQRAKMKETKDEQVKMNNDRTPVTQLQGKYQKKASKSVEQHWKNLSLADALSALDRELSPQPSIETLVHLVRECRKEKNKGFALRMHGYLEKNRLDCHHSLGNDVVSMLVEVGSMCIAQDVFDRMASRSESTWDTLIQGYAIAGEPKQALSMYRHMTKKNLLHPNGKTVVVMLKSCATMKDLEVGRQLHAAISKERLLKANTIVGNALVDMYAKCGSFAEAQEVFDMLPRRNVVTWTSLIAGYAQHDLGEEALKCYKQMQGAHVSPNEFTFACVLKACGSAKKFSMGRKIHKIVDQKGLLQRNVIIGNALVYMYAKCGMLLKAQEVFDMLPVHNVVTWNALITGYAEHDLCREALVCLKKMRRERVPPNAITFASSLKACANIQSIEEGKKIHKKILENEMLKGDLVLASSLIDMYAKCGFMEKAQAVFEKVPVRNAVMWTTLIAGYVQQDAGEKALSCLKRMRAKGVSLDAVTYACSLKACASVGASEIGAGLLREIVERGLLKRNLELANVVVDIYAELGFVEEAHEVFNGIPNRDVITWTALITGYSRLGDVDTVFSIFDRMIEDFTTPNAITFLSILNACTIAGLPDKAEACLKAMRDYFCIIPGIEHYICMVHLVGQLDVAMQVLTLAPFIPSALMWHTLLGACQKWGLYEAC